MDMFYMTSSNHDNEASDLALRRRLAMRHAAIVHVFLEFIQIPWTIAWGLFVILWPAQRTARFGYGYQEDSVADFYKSLGFRVPVSIILTLLLCTVFIIGIIFAFKTLTALNTVTDVEHAILNAGKLLVKVTRWVRFVAFLFVLDALAITLAFGMLVYPLLIFLVYWLGSLVILALRTYVLIKAWNEHTWLTTFNPSR